MADSTSISTFGQIFWQFGKWKKTAVPNISVIAAFIFKLGEQCDFAWEQLDCNDELELLGLYNKETGEYGPQPMKPEDIPVRGP